MLYALTRSHDDAINFPTLACWSFQGAESLSWLSPDPLKAKLPNRLTVMHEEIEQVSDYPLNELNYPIWSDRMLQAVAATGNLEAEIIDVSLVDDLEPNEIRKDFKAVHLIRQVEGSVDFDASEFRAQRYDERLIRAFGKLVFKPELIPDTPAFRIWECSSLTLLSQAAGEALLALDLKGVTIKALEDVSYRW